MKHHHCHCGIGEQVQKFKAGKLGLLGGILIVAHLLFHVAECLVLPAILMAINGDNTVEATTSTSEKAESKTQDWSPVDLTGLDIYILDNYILTH